MGTNNYVATLQKSLTIKNILTLYAVIVFVCNMTSTFQLYAHYGPLTPNGNRYYHSFDISSVSWNMVGLCCVATIALVFPFVFFSRQGMKTVFDVFPATSKPGKVCSAILFIVNIITGTIFSIALLLITVEYLSNHNRIMVEDLETVLLALAYIACSLFWGIINFMYFISVKKKKNIGPNS